MWTVHVPHTTVLCVCYGTGIVGGGAMHGYILPSVSDKRRVSLNLLTQQVFNVAVPLRRASFGFTHAV